MIKLSKAIIDEGVTYRYAEVQLSGSLGLDSNVFNIKLIPTTKLESGEIKTLPPIKILINDSAGVIDDSRRELLKSFNDSLQKYVTDNNL